MKVGSTNTSLIYVSPFLVAWDIEVLGCCNTFWVRRIHPGTSKGSGPGTMGRESCMKIYPVKQVKSGVKNNPLSRTNKKPAVRAQSLENKIICVPCGWALTSLRGSVQCWGQITRKRKTLLNLTGILPRNLPRTCHHEFQASISPSLEYLRG